MTRPTSSLTFLFKAICMWNLHDYLAYGLFTSCQTKGYLACPLCGLEVETRYSTHLKILMVYLGHRRCRAKGHPYGRDCVNAFNGQVKHMPTPFEVDFLRRGN